MQIRDNYTPTYITTAATTQVLTGQGVLVRIVINQTTIGTIKILDNTTGSTATIGTIAIGATPQSIEFGVQVGKGVRIINSANEDITIVTSALPS